MHHFQDPKAPFFGVFHSPKNSFPHVYIWSLFAFSQSPKLLIKSYQAKFTWKTSNSQFLDVNQFGFIWPPTHSTVSICKRDRENSGSCKCSTQGISFFYPLSFLNSKHQADFSNGSGCAIDHPHRPRRSCPQPCIR